jgi:heterodisulfide reductase subunit B
VRFSYYPGCSLLGTAKEFDESTRLVSRKLEADLKDLPDWNCCGASSAHSLNPTLSIALPARNLKIAQAEGLDVVVPCAACFNRMKIADHMLRHDPEMSKKIQDLLDYQYSGALQIIHVLELFDKFIGIKKIKENVVRPLTNLKIVCYYGCLLVRPQAIMNFDDPEYPMILDKLMSAVGAEPLNWSYKTECCGASLSLTRDDIVRQLVGNIVGMAKEAGADAIVVACPLCSQNLEMRQKENMPIFYFTELLGLALDIGDCNKWFEKHLIDVRGLLKFLQLLS